MTATPNRNGLLKEGTAQARDLLRKLRGDLALRYLKEVDFWVVMEFVGVLSVLMAEANNYLDKCSAFLPEEKDKEDPRP